jgi:hypothetical protein
MTSKLTQLGALERLGKQFELLELEGAATRQKGYRTLAIAAAIVLALAAASLTPPGRAVAERIGEIVGIGDEPTGLPEVTHGHREAVVIGVGETPSGTGYEVFAHTGLAMRGDENPITCIGLNAPEEDVPGGGSCFTDDNERALERRPILPLAWYADLELGIDGAITVKGLARDDVAAVELEYEGGDGLVHAVPVEVFELNTALSKSIGSRKEGKFFIGILPESEVLPARAKTKEEVEEAFSRVRIRAVDADGSVLLDERYSNLPLPSWWTALFQQPDKAGAVRAPAPAPVREDAAN